MNNEDRTVPPQLLALLADLPAKDRPHIDFEDRLVAEFHRRPRSAESGCRRLWLTRIGIVLLVSVTLAVRGVVEHNHGHPSVRSQATSSVDVLWRLAIDTPRYLTLPSADAENDRVMASVHTLTTLYIEGALWLIWMTLISFLALAAIRRRIAVTARATDVTPQSVQAPGREKWLPGVAAFVR